MLNTKKIALSIPYSSIETTPAHYTISGNRVHLYIPRFDAIHSFITYAIFTEVETGKEGHLFDLRLIAFGHEHSEYVAKRAILGQDKLSFDANRYIKGIFTLSNDVQRFFNPVWEINDLSPEPSQQITFIPRESRQHLVALTEEQSLSIEQGYAQSFSKIRYQASASIEFWLHFKQPITRETIVQMMQAVADYYSLFCLRFARIETIHLRPDPESQATFLGEPMGDGVARDHFDNILIEQQEIKDYADIHLAAWVGQYEQLTVCVALMKDAEKLNDEQLKFICYSRAMEVFHKQFFVNDAHAPRDYFDTLFNFVHDNGLTEVEWKNFGSSRISLAHRLYDLARYGFDIFSHKDFRLIFGTITRGGGIQQITDSRNYFIHFSEDKRHKSFTTTELPHVNFKLFMMLKVVLLKKFGFNNEAITEVIRTFYNYYFGV